MIVHFFSAIAQLLSRAVARIERVVEALQIAFQISRNRGTCEVVLREASKRGDAEQEASGWVGGGERVYGSSRSSHIAEELRGSVDEEVHEVAVALKLQKCNHILRRVDSRGIWRHSSFCASGGERN